MERVANAIRRNRAGLSDPNRPNSKRTTTIVPQQALFFMNSPMSADSRDWGLVPARLMLGRALMVYWPYNRAGAIR